MGARQPPTPGWRGGGRCGREGGPHAGRLLLAWHQAWQTLAKQSLCIAHTPGRLAEGWAPRRHLVSIRGLHKVEHIHFIVLLFAFHE